MLSLVLALALQATPAAPPSDLPAPPPAAKPADTGEAEPTFGLIQGRRQAKSDRVCFDDAVLGSKIPRKRCMDRETFERRQQDSREHLEAIQRDARAPISR